MELRKVVLGLTVLYLAVTARADANFFPKDNFLPGWKSYAENDYPDDQGLFAYMDGGAELYLEYRFTGLQVKEYSTDEGGGLTIEIYQYAAPEDAFGIFSVDTTGTRIDIGDGGRQSGALTRFWKGNYYVRTFVWEKKPEYRNIPETAARRVAKKLPDNDAFPIYLSQLRAAGLNFAFIRGKIALQQVAGLLDIGNNILNPRHGAVWIFKGDKLASCLVLFYANLKEADTSFQTIWRKIKSRTDNYAQVGERGIATHSDETTEGLERISGAEFKAVIWSPKAKDEATCAETIDRIKSALNGAEE